MFRDTAVEVQEKNLRELHTLLETIDYGVLMLEPDLRVRIHNRAFRELSGMPAESLAGQTYFQDVLEYNRRRGVYGVPDEAWDDYVRSRLDEVQRATALATEWRRADGTVLEYRCVPLPDGGRMLTYYDLTHLKRTEEALQAAKEQAEQASRDEVRVPGQHEPRAADADERDHRLHPADHAPLQGSPARAPVRQSREDPGQRQPSARADQRRARSVQDRGRTHGACGRSSSCSSRCSTSACAPWSRWSGAGACS